MQDARFGKLRHLRFVGYNLYQSPDFWTWLVPTFITVALAAGTMVAAGYVALESRFGWEFVLFPSLVALALLLSALCGLTDPGVVPRPAPGQPDPNEGDESLRHCDYCKIRRPPRANHCHICNVCVLEHDHHCGVIGGCVGQRSLRFFTGYLCTIGVASLLAVSWLVRSMIRKNHNIFASRHSASVARTSASYDDSAGPSLAFHIMLVIFVGNICLVVGCLGLYYVYLTCTDTTRREAQRGKGGNPGESAALFRHEHRSVELRNRWTWRFLGRLGRVMQPPPSLLDEIASPMRFQAAKGPPTDADRVALV